MERNIAVVLAVLVVVGALLYGSEENSVKKLARPLKLELPAIFSESGSGSAIQDEGLRMLAWDTFERYREYAKTGNLEGVRSLSYRLSEACKDPARAGECKELMGSVYNFTRDFQLSDFDRVAYDTRQIVMSAIFKPQEEGGVPVTAALMFTRTAEGAPKVLGLKFCFGEQTAEQGCINTDPVSRDKDNNGWWDDLEYRLK